jgi:2',3'-cyclic-nucleotide 2'-phosphodiesterase (5'-nucleotidase family)
VLLAFLSSPAWSAEKPAGASAPRVVKITILHVNDTHGQLLGTTVGGKNTGGFARLATVVRQERESSSAARVFLVHCGDEFTRGDKLTSRSGGAANIALMNFLRFDLWTPGNGEFYYGVNSLRSRLAEARFPSLAANIIDADGRPVAKEYVVEQAGPVKVAFLGLCFAYGEHLKLDGLKLSDPVATARRLVPQLRKEADVVVAVTHIGLLEDLRLAGSVSGIDVILGAHTHTALQHGWAANGPGGRKVLICQAGDMYRYCGRMDLELTGEHGRFKIASAEARLIPLDQAVPPDPSAEALLRKLSARASWPVTTKTAGTSRPVFEPAER